MIRKTLCPASCGATMSQPLGSQSRAAAGRLASAQCAPPSVDARTAPEAPAQKLVIQPTSADWKATPSLSHPTGRPLPVAGSAAVFCDLATTDQCTPPSVLRYSETGFCSIAAPRLSSSQPRLGLTKSIATGSAARPTGADSRHD